jgi:ABC-2 type transport system ATP-binding protein
MIDATVVSVEALTKSYKRRTVLNAVSIEVRAGEAVAIIGPNGAGKSTFLGCITGERLPDSGSVKVCGIDPFADPNAVARVMGYVPEHPFLYGELTVSETLRFVAEAHRLDREASLAEIARLLAAFGLADTEGALCRELSQGMARKLAIIAVLLHRPRLLILDEVFNGLDRTSSERLIAELNLRRADGAAVLLSSHDLTLLAEWCGRGLLLAPEGWRELVGEAWRAWRDAPRLTG